MAGACYLFLCSLIVKPFEYGDDDDGQRRRFRTPLRGACFVLFFGHACSASAIIAETPLLSTRMAYKLVMLERLFAAAAWLTLAFIAYTTLSPIGLRPAVTNPEIERFGAYAVAGFLFVMAYPRRKIFAFAIVIGAAIVLEALQLVTPDRHGQFANLVVKVFGGVTGLASAGFISYAARSEPEKSE